VEFTEGVRTLKRVFLYEPEKKSGLRNEEKKAKKRPEQIGVNLKKKGSLERIQINSRGKSN